MPGKTRSEIVLDGKTYFASPLPDKDIQELDLFVKQQFMKSVYETFPDGISDDAKAQAIQIAQLTCSRMTFMSGEGSRIIGTVPGMTRLTWQMLHHNHPDLTIEELHQLMLSPTNVNEANEKFREVNNLNPGKHKRRKKPKQHQPRSPKKRKK